MLGNDEIMKWLAVPSRDNLGMFSFAPKIVSPQVTRVGIIQALNMEVYTYGETYLDDDENPKPFIGEMMPSLLFREGVGSCTEQ